MVLGTRGIPIYEGPKSSNDTLVGYIYPQTWQIVLFKNLEQWALIHGLFNQQPLDNYIYERLILEEGVPKVCVEGEDEYISSWIYIPTGTSKNPNLKRDIIKAIKQDHVCLNQVFGHTLFSECFTKIRNKEERSRILNEARENFIKTRKVQKRTECSTSVLSENPYTTLLCEEV